MTHAPALIAYFLGTWTCGGTIPATASAPAFSYHTPNVFASAPGGQWITNRWGAADRTGGIAYIGFVPAQKLWVYDDYHYDGSMARVTSPGLIDGKWIWSGPYFTADGKTLHGRIIYAIESKSRYDRIFESPDGSGWKKLGSDSCTK